MKTVKNSILMMMTLLFSMLMMTLDSPLVMWIIMEISNMMFIMMFILMQKNNINASATMILTQFFSSTLILMGIVQENNIMLSLGILTKLGMAPAHTWVTMIIYQSPWKLNMLFMTIPKIPPFLMMDLLTSHSLIMMSIIMTTVMMTIKLIKTSSIKMMMALSSMIHSSWMVLAQSISFKCWMIYFSIYSINTLMICSMLHKNLLINFNMNKIYNTVYMMMMFSMMATPPITMFLGKLFLVFKMEYMMIMPLMFLMLSSSISIMFYSRMFTRNMYMYSKTNKIKIKYKNISIKWILFMLLLMMII